ncbi:Transcriptional regulatory protein, C terminal [endosymbiont of Ridgeia piscesae]|jgi:DNA-binding winged helix-turn-helix (wHTH) protein/TolB-like protein|uniref:Transcriptional regulatory protein, C terminal n=3 Tax=endosymbiont of Ridgeia piscesae TaxID=54398 RepID=A0A0T5YV23_9GAMM|nr:winged helix-turn-helix domain-containing protein [endosymbiont of Ridgeia piscesae]KRT54441.1 Transcriptional regulatory protein, C terminal [endosymbiont of Ridgeia piscesae]
MQEEKTDLAEQSIRGGGWLLDAPLNQIEQDGRGVRLEPKAMALLLYLAQRADEVVSRKQLLSALWPGVIVSDDALTQVIIKLRKALGDDARHPRYIQTISKHGYRLIAQVENLPLKEPPADGGKKSVNWLPQRPLWWGTGVTQPRSAPLTISVLPFKTAADDAVSIRFAGGITADLADDLSRLSEIWVINDPGGSGDLHHEKRARYLVSGSVFHAQERLLVHVQLTESATAHQLWSERFDHPLGELFDMQSEISRRVVDQLSLRVSQAERRHLARRYTRNLAAYGYFLDAQVHLLTRETEDNRQARALYRLAIEQAPAFARAHTGLALSHAADYRNQ